MSDPSVSPIVATIATIQKFQACPVSGSSWLVSDDQEAGVRQDQLRGERDHRASIAIASMTPT